MMESVNAEIVSVGTELLLGQILDTHAPRMAKILAECGIGCRRRATVGDNLDRVVECFKEALSRSDILITIGGLGPTEDDLTRDAITIALEDTKSVDENYAEVLERFFTSRNLKFVKSNLRQAERPSSARFIDNPYGTAPGLLCQKNGKVVIAMPGPKGEFNPMANGPVKEFLSTVTGGSVIHSRILRVCGLGESFVEDQIRALLESENPSVAPYAHTGEVHLRVTAKAGSVAEADTLIDPMEAKIREILGNAVFGVDDTTFEQATLEMLRDHGFTLALAESVTGGGLANRIASVPGASQVFLGGMVAYSADMKVNHLGLDRALIDKHGPVSEQVAHAMAVRARDLFGASYGIATTGNAGPTSDVGGQPVGLVFVAVAGPNGVEVSRSQFRGVREDIRRRAEQTALQLLRQQLLILLP